MMFYYLASNLEPIILEKKPTKVLEISEWDSSGYRYGRLVSTCFSRFEKKSGEEYVDRVEISEHVATGESPYRNIFPLEVLNDHNTLGNYDLILIADLFEQLDMETAKTLISNLCVDVCKHVVIVVPNKGLAESFFDSGLVEYKRLVIEAVPENLRIFTVQKRTTAPIKLKSTKLFG